MSISEGGDAEKVTFSMLGNDLALFSTESPHNRYPKQCHGPTGNRHLPRSNRPDTRGKLRLLIDVRSSKLITRSTHVFRSS
jgi:hypothetical protein